jgi:hypothetical protein
MGTVCARFATVIFLWGFLFFFFRRTVLRHFSYGMRRLWIGLLLFTTQLPHGMMCYFWFADLRDGDDSIVQSSIEDQLSFLENSVALMMGIGVVLVLWAFVHRRVFARFARAWYSLVFLITTLVCWIVLFFGRLYLDSESDDTEEAKSEWKPFEQVVRVLGR